MKVKIFLKKIEIKNLRFLKRRSKFRYLRDPLFLLSVAIYFLNRYLLKSFAGDEISFFKCYLNDLICIPFWLPLVLFVTRVVRLREDDNPPDFYEVSFYLLMWSFVFEYVGPSYGKYFNYPVADPWDIFFYAIGAIVGGVYWNVEFTKPLTFHKAKSIKLCS